MRNRPPLGDGARHLNIACDPGETRHLAGDRPELLARMIEAYQAYKEHAGVLTVPDNQSPVVRMARRAAPWLAGGPGAIMLVIALGIAVRWRGRAV